MTTIEYTSAANDFFGDNSLNFINDRRTFNQATDNHSDPCEYKQLLNLATKPMEYYVNSLNNPQGTNNPNLAFTPVGNAQVENISNVFDRPIPSTLQRTGATYTLPYGTSPNLGMQTVANPLATDEDITLKTGLTLRHKLNDFSAHKFPSFSDIITESMGPLVQNAGQFFGLNVNGQRVLSNRLDSQIPGLNEQQSLISNGTGVVWGDYSGQLCGADSRSMLLNYQTGPFKGNSRKDFNLLLAKQGQLQNAASPGA